MEYWNDEVLHDPRLCNGLVAADVRKGVELARKVQVVDVAPTLCHLLGWSTPANVKGSIVYEALGGTNWFLKPL